MYSDEKLTAYLDDELEAAETAAITRAVAQDPAVAARLAALDLDMAALQSAFAPLLNEAPGALPAASRWSRRLAYAAAACLLLGVGAGVFGFITPAKNGWEIEVAHYQALYVGDTLAGIAPDEARLASQLTRASGLLGLPLETEALAGFEGMTLRRAQVLGYEGQVLIQIAYSMADGTPVAFCILKRQHAVDMPIEGVELVGLAAAKWQNAEHGFLTIGGQDVDEMKAFASYLQAAL